MNKLLMILTTAILLFTILGCGTISNLQDDFPYDLMIGLADLPQNFEYRNSGFEEVEGGKSFYVTYGKKSGETGAVVSHQITIYPDIESAKRSIPTWENQLFTKNWSQPKESLFRPGNPDDFYELKCLPTQINERKSQGCRMLQQHNNLVVLILVNIDSENISYTEFDRILEKLDARLPSETIPLPSSE
jgi:hypothetical protein